MMVTEIFNWPGHSLRLCRSLAESLWLSEHCFLTNCARLSLAQ
jgi:hypothetical protein